MEMHEAHEVKEVYSSQQANAAIQQEGWKLLAVTAVTNPEAPQFVTVCYVLGKKVQPKPLNISAEALARANGL